MYGNKEEWKWCYCHTALWVTFSRVEPQGLLNLRFQHVLVLPAASPLPQDCCSSKLLLAALAASKQMENAVASSNIEGSGHPRFTMWGCLEQGLLPTAVLRQWFFTILCCIWLLKSLAGFYSVLTASWCIRKTKKGNNCLSIDLTLWKAGREWLLLWPTVITCTK